MKSKEDVSSDANSSQKVNIEILIAFTFRQRPHFSAPLHHDVCRVKTVKFCLVVEVLIFIHSNSTFQKLNGIRKYCL